MNRGRGQIIPLRTFLGGDGAAAAPVTRTPAVRATSPIIPGMDPLLTTLSQAKAGLGLVNTAGALANAVTTPQLDAAGNPVLDAAGNPVMAPPTISSQFLGGAQAASGALQLALALANSRQPAPARALQGAAGATTLASGALKLAPETARELLPATGAFSPNALSSNLGYANAALGAGMGAYQLAQGNVPQGLDALWGAGVSLLPGGPILLAAKAIMDLGLKYGHYIGLGSPDTPPSAQSRHDAEAEISRWGFADAIKTARTPQQIAAIFNAVAGRQYSAADIVNPTVLARELEGPLFDPSAGGSAYSLNQIGLARALAAAGAGPATQSLFAPETLAKALAPVPPGVDPLEHWMNTDLSGAYSWASPMQQLQIRAYQAQGFSPREITSMIRGHYDPAEGTVIAPPTKTPAALTADLTRWLQTTYPSGSAVSELVERGVLTPSAAATYQRLVARGYTPEAALAWLRDAPEYQVVTPDVYSGTPGIM